ncbi:winged helix DNA-binding protein [Tyzzerella sp. OttesenSCG-928-J15]|nr:winged helix DNA-binding protein [Tyzzerella sp. OttesenSCG-928-J15]
MEIEKAELSRLFLELIESGRKSKNKVVCNDFKVNAFGPGEVGEKQFVILFCITCLNITTITELATYTNQSTGSMSITISKLVDSGHLCKSRRLGENEDKRRVYYEATQKGMALLEK